MKIRREITEAKKSADKLTVRQMEYVEKIAQIDLERYRAQAGKMTSEHRAIVWGIFFAFLLLLAGFTYWHLSYFYAAQENIAAMTNGYTKQPRLGTNILYWSKENEEDSDKRHQVGTNSGIGQSEHSQRNSVSDRPSGRDSLREQSEESTTILPGLSGIPNREGTNR